jgi:flavin reductase (DIM6/NTAB) family NADH-FMN oxidoreductase RutF/rubredoxin
MNIESFFKVSYGLYIISSGKQGKKSGYIANTAFQVTSKPARFAISCSKDNFTNNIIRQSKAFAISVLSQDVDQSVINLFGYTSTKQKDKFASSKFITGKTGIPIVTQGCIAWFECELEQEITLDTHTIFIGTVVENELLAASAEPLTYAFYRDVKKGIAPKNAPTYINKELLGERKIELSESEKQGKMKKYRCLVCGHIYDPEEGDPDTGIPAGTAFEDLPDDWYCPVCNAGKEDFEPMA